MSTIENKTKDVQDMTLDERIVHFTELIENTDYIITTIGTKRIIFDDDEPENTLKSHELIHEFHININEPLIKSKFHEALTREVKAFRDQVQKMLDMTIEFKNKEDIHKWRTNFETKLNRSIGSNTVIYKTVSSKLCGLENVTFYKAEDSFTFRVQFNDTNYGVSVSNPIDCDYAFAELALIKFNDAETNDKQTGDKFKVINNESLGYPDSIKQVENMDEIVNEIDRIQKNLDKLSL